MNCCRHARRSTAWPTGCGWERGTSTSSTRCAWPTRTRAEWTILFEDAELGVLESVSDERPLADIRLVERLIYA